MPVGWSLVPFSTDVLDNVVKLNPFGTDLLVFANGAAYGGAQYSSSRYTSSGLATSGSSYKCTACSGKVLMMKPSVDQTSKSTNFDKQAH